MHGAGAARAGARHAGRLKVAFALIVSFLVVQVVVGLATNSLALLSDAGHMATDALGLGMALAAIAAANRQDHPDHRTFGLYRLEILAALANAVLLFAVAAYVLVEAVLRLADSGRAEVASVPVFVMGVLGLVVNVVAFLMLRPGAAESINVRGAYLEVLSDMLGSVGVIVAAAVMWTTGWHWVDPVVGAAIGLFILPRAYRLGRDAVRVLVQAAPADLSVDDIESALRALDNVTDVHDLHVWTLTSEMNVLTAHLTVCDGASTGTVLSTAQTLLADRFGLTHATLQVEEGDDPRCHDLSW
jgi:cobalt-zinc-cadmium efflux system protein